jgi:hypothetical protein
MLSTNSQTNILLLFHSLIVNTFFLEGLIYEAFKWTFFLNESIIESQKPFPASSSHKWRNAPFGSLCFIVAYNYLLTLY